MAEWFSEASKVNERFQRCLDLANLGGGSINVVMDLNKLENIFHPDWVVNTFQSLNMVNVLIPAHGCFSLMHPEVIMWEINRNDIQHLPQEDFE